MTAVDTNVLVRLLTQDDRRQAVRANTLFATGPIFIAKTVLLETNWVLRSLYGFGDNAVQGGFTMLLGLPNVRMEDEAGVAEALSLVSQGIEFADGLHLVSRPRGARFVSFDRDLIRRAGRAGVREIDTIR